jgi:hypothetical protein
MAGIYDMAARLDTQGIEAPARLDAARISLAEQSAREAPLQFQRQQKIWGREDEQYKQGQEEAKQQKQMARYGQMSQEMAKLAMVAQTPQSFVRNAQKVLGDAASLPIFATALSDALQADPVKWKEMQTQLGGAFGNIGKLVESQLATRQESVKQGELTSRSEIEQGAMTERSEQEIAGRQRVAETNATSREKVQQMKADLINNKANETGIDPLDLSRIYDQAEQNLKSREGWDDKEKQWAADSKYRKTEKKYGSMTGFDWTAKDRAYFDADALGQDLEAEVDKILGETGYLRTDSGIRKQGAQGLNNLIDVDY